MNAAQLAATAEALAIHPCTISPTHLIGHPPSHSPTHRHRLGRATLLHWAGVLHRGRLQVWAEGEGPTRAQRAAMHAVRTQVNCSLMPCPPLPLRCPSLHSGGTRTDEMYIAALPCPAYPSLPQLRSLAARRTCPRQAECRNAPTRSPKRRSSCWRGRVRRSAAVEMPMAFSSPSSLYPAGCAR